MCKIENDKQIKSADEFEKYVSKLEADGYISERGQPLKCIHCDSERLEDKNTFWENHFIVEYETWCVNCSKLLGVWSYGYWDNSWGGTIMNRVEVEQLKNHLAVKVGTLENKIQNGEIADDTAVELVNLFKDYEKNGTTIEDLKLLFDDVMLALS